MEYEKRDLSRGLLVSAFIVGAASLILLPLTLTLFLQEAAGRVPCLLGEVVLGIVAAMLAARVGRRRNGWLVALFALIGLAGPALLGLLYLFLYAAAGAASGGAWGRPLRLRGRVLHPDLRLGSDWTRGALPSPAGLDQPTRDALEALWLHDAQKEHASVPAFSRLSWLLAAVGAPPDLIAAVHGAAVEEIDHARRCFALAAGYGGRTHTAEPMPDLLDRAALALDGDALSAIAVESVKDGCLLEDFNADVAAACAAVCVEPVTRDVLERISREERSHAELSWRVVAFCVERGGARVRRAVAAVALDRVARPTAASMEKAALVAAADEAALRRHGRLGDDQWAALWTPRLAATAERLRAILDERAAA